MSSSLVNEKGAEGLPEHTIHAASLPETHSARRLQTKLVGLIIAVALFLTYWYRPTVHASQFHPHPSAAKSQVFCHQAREFVEIEPVTGRYAARGSQHVSANLTEVVIDIQAAARYSTLEVVELPPPDSIQRGHEHIITEFVAEYEHPSVWHNTSVCMRLEGTERGTVSFQTKPFSFSSLGHGWIIWHIRVSLPHGTHVPVFKIRHWGYSSLAVNMNIPSVTFGHLSVKGGAAVNLNGVVAEHVLVNTPRNGSVTGNVQACSFHADLVEGRIGGIYNVTDVLELKTRNEPIEAWIILNNDGSRPTRAVLETTNAPIDIDWTLEKAATAGLQTLFDINAQTTNKPLSMFFQDSPESSTLYLNGKTSNARINTNMHIEYEGHVHAITTNEPIEFTQQQGPSDPWYPRSRKWDFLRFNDQHTRMHGYVEWGFRPRDAGRAVFETTNAPVALTV